MVTITWSGCHILTREEIEPKLWEILEEMQNSIEKIVPETGAKCCLIIDKDRAISDIISPIMKRLELNRAQDRLDDAFKDYE